MGLRLVDDGKDSEDDRATTAEARQSVAAARGRLEGLADRLAQLRRRLGEGTSGGTEADDTKQTTGYPGASE